MGPGSWSAASVGCSRSGTWTTERSNTKLRESFDWGLGKAWGIAFDPSGDRAAVCGKGGKVIVWDVDY
jgi:WD40 repeat protein